MPEANDDPYRYYRDAHGSGPTRRRDGPGVLSTYGGACYALRRELGVNCVQNALFSAFWIIQNRDARRCRALFTRFCLDGAAFRRPCPLRGTLRSPPSRVPAHALRAVRGPSARMCAPSLPRWSAQCPTLRNLPPPHCGAVGLCARRFPCGSPVSALWRQARVA